MDEKIMHLVVLGLGAAILCTSHLGVGFLAGYRMANVRRVPDAPPYLEHVVALVERSQELHLQLGEHLRELPDRVMLAAAKLLQAAEVVQREIPAPKPSQRLVDPYRLSRHPTQSARSLATCDAQLAGTDFVSLIFRGDHGSMLLDANEEAERYGYPNDQFVAFFAGEFPAGEDFEQVRCKDISVNGISFFLNRRPDKDKLVISLGAAPNLTFMVARVMNSRRTYTNGQECYRVGCRFVRRVDPGRYCWNEDWSAIETPNCQDAQNELSVPEGIS
jgi:hypothetical protein